MEHLPILPAIVQNYIPSVQLSSHLPIGNRDNTCGLLPYMCNQSVRDISQILHHVLLGKLSRQVPMCYYTKNHDNALAYLYPNGF